LSFFLGIVSLIGTSYRTPNGEAYQQIEISKLTNGRNMVRSLGFKYRLDVPKGWEARRPRGKHVDCLAADKNGSSVTIVVRPFPGIPKTHTYDDLSKEEIKKLADALIWELKSVYNDVKVEKLSFTYLNNRKAIIFIHSEIHRYPETSFILKGYSVNVVNNGYQYSINLSAAEDQFTKYDKTFQGILNSFIFEDEFQ